MSPSSLYQNVTQEGNIIIENGTYTIENMEFHIHGNITVKNDAIMVVKNSILFLSPIEKDFYPEAIAFRNTSHFVLENSTVVAQVLNYQRPRITLYDNSEANLTSLNQSCIETLFLRNSSKLWMKDSILQGPKSTGDSSIIAEDGSTAQIESSWFNYALSRGHSVICFKKSTISDDEIGAQDTGSITIEDSTIGFSQGMGGSSNLTVSNSTLDGIFFHGARLEIENSVVTSNLWLFNASVWIKNTPLSSVRAEGQSVIWLIDSPVGPITTDDNSVVYVGKELPIFGIIAVPHTWIPVLQNLLFLAVLVIVIALLIVVHDRWKRRKRRPNEPENDANT